MEQRIPISPGERDLMRSYLSAVESAKRDVGVAAGVILMRAGITETNARLERITETEMVVQLAGPRLVEDTTAAAQVPQLVEDSPAAARAD